MRKLRFWDNFAKTFETGVNPKFKVREHLCAPNMLKAYQKRKMEWSGHLKNAMKRNQK